MKTKNFEIGDEVFDIRYGWGKVINKFINSTKFTLYVLFDDSDRILSYTEDGRNSTGAYAPTLSHTEYSIHSTQSEYPKVMEVSDCGTVWRKRVVFMEKKGIFIAWAHAETFEEAEEEIDTHDWKYIREIQEHREISMQEIADKFGISVEEVRIKK